MIKYARPAVISILIALLLATFPFAAANAAAPKNKGLFISPLRTYTTVDENSHKTGSFTVANLTTNTITVNLTVEQFSVADYAYDYRFSEPDNNWLKLGITQVSLKPNESHNIPYAISTPANSIPGGHYYTLVASANLSQAGLDSTVQATSLLYLTVNGKLVKTSSFESSSTQRFVFASQIPYTIALKNTGNVHYFAYFSGKLDGLFYKNDSTGASHLLLPGTIRQITENIPSPLLPGIYKATYGYQTDSGTTRMQSDYIVFIPPWSVVALVLLILSGRWLYRRKKIISRQETDA